MTDERVRDLRKRIRVAGGLPVFSRTLQDVLELIHSQNVSMPILARAIEKDPALAARVLKLANSAFYGLSQQVASLNLALVLLGLRNIQNMVLSLGFLDVLADADESGAYPGPGFRRHSFQCGRSAMLLAQIHDVSAGGEEFVAGLIHDLGKLVLYRAYPERVAEASDRLKDVAGPELVILESEIFSVGHPEAGAWAASEWRLPIAIVRAIAEHENEPETPDPSDLSHLVHAADRLTHWLEDHEGPLDTAVLPKAWQGSAVLSHPGFTCEKIQEYVVEGDIPVFS